jgi:hypothetical protein
VSGVSDEVNLFMWCDCGIVVEQQTLYAAMHAWMTRSLVPDLACPPLLSSPAWQSQRQQPLTAPPAPLSPAGQGALRVLLLPSHCH